MSDTKLYRRALARFAISVVLTIAGVLICSEALCHAVGDGAVFTLILLLMVPWAWTLRNIWQHTLNDLRRVNDILAVREFEQGLAIVRRNA